MRNKLIDLNNHLFAQLERLGDEELKGDDLKAEINRAKATAGLAREVVNNGKLALEAQQYADEQGRGSRLPASMPEMLTHDDRRNDQDGK